MQTRPTKAWTGLIALGALLLTSSAEAQVGRAYCNLSEVEAVQLANAVRINIRCDGQIQGGMELWHYVDFDEINETFTAIHPVRRVSFYLSNAKSKVGSFADISRYPVSHLEFSPIPDSPDGVGLIITLVLYVEGAIREVALPGESIREDWLRWAGFGPKPGEVRWMIQEAEDQRGVQILVTSDRMPPVDGEDEGDIREPQLSVARRNGLVDVRAVHAPMDEVLEAIGRAGGVSVEAPEITERVSTYLCEVDPVEAIRIIARLQGMSVEPSEGGVRLSGRPASGWGTYPEAEVRTIPLAHIRPEEALLLLPVFLLSRVAEEPQSNALVASGPPALLDKIAADVAEVDVPAKHIEVAVQVLTYFGDQSLAYQLGLEGRIRGAWMGADSEGVSNVLVPLAGGLAEDVAARLTALRRQGDLKSRVRKRIRVVNGRKAELFVGQQPTIVTTYWDHSRNAPRPQLEIIDVGAGLEVEPWTGSGDHITARIVPTVTSIRETDTRTGLPTLSVRGSDSTVRVRNGESVYIGGMTLTQTDKAERRNDAFDDWPLLEDIFTGRFRLRTSAEIGFIVTLRVVQ